MRSSQLDFSGASNIVDPFAGLKGALQQTSGTMGQMIEASEKAKARAVDEAYRRDALAIQQAQEKRAVDAANKVTNDELVTRQVLDAYNKAPTTGGTYAADQLMKVYGKEVDATALTQEELANPELESAQKKMKDQLAISQGYTNWYDKFGNEALTESERMKLAINDVRQKTGKDMPLGVYEKQLGMQAAENAALQAKSDKALALAADRSKTAAASELKLAETGVKEQSKMNRASISPMKEDIKSGKVEKMDSTDIEKMYAFGDKMLGSVADDDEFQAFVLNAAEAGTDKKLVHQALSAGLSKGKGTFYDSFDLEAAQATLDKLKADILKNPVRSGTQSAQVDLSPLQRIAERNKISALQAAETAKNTPLTMADIERARNVRGKEGADFIMSEFNRLRGTSTSSAAKPTEANVPVAPTSMSSVTERVQEGTPRYPSMNKRFTNEELAAMEADIAEMKNQPKQATNTVQTGDNSSNSFMSPEARNARGKALTEFFTKNRDIQNPFTVISDAYNARWNKSTPDLGSVNKAPAIPQRKPIPREEMLKLTDADITNILQRPDLTDAERKLAGSIYSSPRKPAASQNVDRVAFDIVNNSTIAPMDKYTQLVSLGIPIATAQQLAFSK